MLYLSKVNGLMVKWVFMNIFFQFIIFEYIKDKALHTHTHTHAHAHTHTHTHTHKLQNCIKKT